MCTRQKLEVNSKPVIEWLHLSMHIHVGYIHTHRQTDNPKTMPPVQSTGWVKA